MTALAQAFKEWAVAVDALLSGDLILLLRKGGLYEAKGRFALQAERFLLMPTYEHQRPEWVKPPYQDLIIPVSSGWHPDMVVVQGWAEVTRMIPLQEEDQVWALMPFHLWSEQFVRQRWQWQPDQPLHLMLLRSHRLPTPQMLPFRPEYGGCRSWITLAESIAIADSTEVLAPNEYLQKMQAILAAVGVSDSSDENVDAGV